MCKTWIATSSSQPTSQIGGVSGTPTAMRSCSVAKTWRKAKRGLWRDGWMTLTGAARNNGLRATRASARFNVSNMWKARCLQQACAAGTTLTRGAARWDGDRAAIAQKVTSWAAWRCLFGTRAERGNQVRETAVRGILRMSGSTRRIGTERRTIIANRRYGRACFLVIATRAPQPQQSPWSTLLDLDCLFDRQSRQRLAIARSLQSRRGTTFVRRWLWSDCVRGSWRTVWRDKVKIVLSEEIEGRRTHATRPSSFALKPRGGRCEQDYGAKASRYLRDQTFLYYRPINVTNLRAKAPQRTPPCAPVW